MSYSLRNVASGGFRVLGVVAVLVFVALLLDVGIAVYFANVSKNWPCTIGAITENTESRTKEHTYGTTPIGHFYEYTWTSVRRRLQYRYVVDGQEYTGSRIAFVADEDKRRELDRLYGDVPVFYDPHEPSRCVLHPGVQTSAAPALAILLAGLGFSLVLAYSGASLFEWPFRLLRLYNARR